MRVSQFLSKGLPYLITAVAVLGVLTGATSGPLRCLKVAVLPLLFLMIFPMAMGIRLEYLWHATLNLRLLSASVVGNFVVSPLLGLLLTGLLLRDHPELAGGFLLLSTIPTGGMAAAWVGFARGNVALILVMVALNLLLAIGAVPLLMGYLARSYVAVDPLFILKKIALIVVIPLAAGNLTRWFLVHSLGEEAYKQRVRPLLPAFSSLGALGIVFIATNLHALAFLRRPAILLQIVLPIVLFYLLLYLWVLIIDRSGYCRTYENEVALLYSLVTKNLTIALALALTSFGGLAVLMPAVAYPVQALAAAFFVHLAPRVLKVPRAALSP